MYVCIYFQNKGIRIRIRIRIESPCNLLSVFVPLSPMVLGVLCAGIGGLLCARTTFNLSVPTSIVFDIEFLAVSFGCFVLSYICCLMVAGVVMEIYGWPEKDRVSSSYTVNVARAFASVI